MTPNLQTLVGQELQQACLDPKAQALSKRLSARRITPQSTIPKRQFLFSLFGTPCFPRGEIVALSGKEKSGKTFVTSLLMALGSRRTLLDMTRLPEPHLRILWYDTEQSEESTQEILLERIRPLIEKSLDTIDLTQYDASLSNYDVFNVRGEPWSDRMPLLDVAMQQCRPDLVILDGIRDLVNDINDGQLSQQVMEHLMHLASDMGCCIVCILHQNKSSEDRNLRGWIGTELTYKAFEVYECKKDDDRVFSLHQIRTRKFDIDQKMLFTVDADGLPVPVVPQRQGSASDRAGAGPTDAPACTHKPLNRQYVVSADGQPLVLDYRAFFADAMPQPGQIYQASYVMQRVMELTGIDTYYFYGKWLHKALADGTLLEAPRDSEGHIMYYRPAPPEATC